MIPIHTISLLFLLCSLTLSAANHNVREAFFRSRINDTTIPANQRIAYMDSIIAIYPDQVEMRKLKSDLCYRSGDYAGAALEYMTLAESLNNKLEEHDKLRAMNMAALTLMYCNRPIEATEMVLKLIRTPKSDSLAYYNLMAREIAINTALVNKDAKAMAEYLNQQLNEFKDLTERNFWNASNKNMRKDMLSVIDTHTSEYQRLIISVH